nr:hypothetical protein [uncultured Desulfobulbus sp.]
MFTCQKTQHKHQGKHQGRGRGKCYQESLESRQSRFGRGCRGQNSFTVRSRIDNTPEATENALNVSCPLCKNHCPLSEPGCPKGEAFVQSMQGKGE